MKLKKLNIIFLLAGFIFAIQSCSDNFIELESKTQKLENNSYNTQEDAFNAMVATYDALHIQNWNFVPTQSDVFSDDAYCGGEPGGGMQQWADQETSLIDPDNSAATELWKRCYAGIYRANLYLQKDDVINWQNQDKRNRMKAEVKVLRAHFYWDLVRHFGWVPLMSSLLSDIQDYSNISQSTPEETFKFIMTDLLAEMSNLPDKATSAEYGRITKDMVKVLIARIYLLHEGFVKPVMGVSSNLTDGTTTIDKNYVKTIISEIINSGRYTLLANYSDVFDWKNENNEESIFEWQYSEKAISNDWGGWSVDGNFVSVFYGPRSPIGDSSISTGWSFATMSWSLADEFENGDTRKDVTIYNADKKLTSYAKGHQNTGYFNYKYMPRSAYKATSGTADHNWSINYKDMRYAEVLLIAAELYMNDDNVKATKYLNQVRTRAMGDEAALSSITLDDIYHERRVEFGGEGHRKWDLLRRGLDYAKQKIDASWVLPTEADSPDDFAGGVFKKDTWGMLPIPAGEIRKMNSGVMQQYIPAFQ